MSAIIWLIVAVIIATRLFIWPRVKYISGPSNTVLKTRGNRIVKVIPYREAIIKKKHIGWF